MSSYLTIKLITIAVLLIILLFVLLERRKPNKKNEETVDVDTEEPTSLFTAEEAVSPFTAKEIKESISAFKEWLQHASLKERQLMLITALVRVNNYLKDEDIPGVGYHIQDRMIELYSSLDKESLQEIYPDTYVLRCYINGMTFAGTSDEMYNYFQEHFKKEEILIDDATFRAVMVDAYTAIEFAKEDNTVSRTFFDDSKSSDMEKRKEGSAFWIVSAPNYDGDGFQLLLYKNNWGTKADYMISDDGFVEIIKTVRGENVSRLLRLCNNANNGREVVDYLYDRFSPDGYSAYTNMFNWFESNGVQTSFWSWP